MERAEPAARRKLIEDLWAQDASYVDPIAEAHGREAIDATIAAVQERCPDFVFTALGAADAHHGVARFSLGLGPDGSRADGVARRCEREKSAAMTSLSENLRSRDLPACRSE